jgi:cobaltochelatase CobT
MAEFLSRSRVRIFESALEKLARILAAQWGIVIIFRHDCCMTDGKRVYLPVIPENASDEFIAAIQGFLDHEVGHLMFSDFEALKQIENFARKLWNIVQALEDARIEHEMRKLWRGCGVNLNNCNNWALKQLQERWGELTLFGKLCQGLATIGCDGEDHWFVTDVLKKDQEVWEQLEKVKHLALEARNLPNSEAVVDQAKKLMAILGIEEEASPPQPQPQPGSGGSEELEEVEEPTPQSGPAGEGEEGEGEEQQGQGTNTNSEFEDVDDEAVKLDEEIRSRHNMIKNYCKKQGIAKRDRYLIYTTEGDVVENITRGDKTGTVEFLRQSRAMVNVLLKRMRLNLLSTSQAKWESDKRRGKINPGAIFRVSVGTSKRVFRQRVEGPSFDTRASLYIDHSGSMEGDKLELAAKSALLFGEVLHELGIPFEVVGYSTTDYETGKGRYRRAKDEEREVFTRWGNLWLGIYKSFEEDWQRVRHRCYRMTHQQKCNTYDGEVIRLATARLLRYPEKRRILFVFNDGCPCPNIAEHMPQHARYLKEITPQAEKLVELFAIGIQSASVAQFYSNSVVINEVEDLPKVMLTQLDSMLRKGKSLIKIKAA